MSLIGSMIGFELYWPWCSRSVVDNHHRYALPVLMTIVLYIFFLSLSPISLSLSRSLLWREYLFIYDDSAFRESVKRQVTPCSIHSLPIHHGQNHTTIISHTQIIFLIQCRPMRVVSRMAGVPRTAVRLVINTMCFHRSRVEYHPSCNIRARK